MIEFELFIFPINSLLSNSKYIFDLMLQKNKNYFSYRINLSHRIISLLLINNLL